MQRIRRLLLAACCRPAPPPTTPVAFVQEVCNSGETHEDLYA